MGVVFDCFEVHNHEYEVDAEFKTLFNGDVALFISFYVKIRSRIVEGRGAVEKKHQK